MAKSCDICGKEVQHLEILNTEYQTKEIKEVCDDCLRTLNKHLSDVRRLQIKLQHTLMERVMIALRDKFRK